jgi:hypothetical protein
VNVDSIARLITLFFDALVLPFGHHRTAALVAVSIGSGAVFALVFKAASKPESIRRARSRFQARVLEMRLYPDDLVLLVRALGGALATQLEYFRAAGKPILLLAVLALPAFFQIESRFAGRPLHANERTLVTATLKPGLDVRAVSATLGSSDGVTVDARPVRVRATREIVWRVEAKDAGVHELILRVYDKDVRFPLRVKPDSRALGSERRAGHGWDSFVHAGLPSIPDDSAIESIRVSYPDASYRVLSARLGWLSLFLAGSLVGAVIPAWILRIQL